MSRPRVFTRQHSNRIVAQVVRVTAHATGEDTYFGTAFTAETRLAQPGGCAAGGCGAEAAARAAADRLAHPDCRGVGCGDWVPVRRQAHPALPAEVSGAENDEVASRE